ncbi:MAG: PBP1A family penicillin-binding protein [Epulopiscium sp.]|nr:PBP1A family penicillin-binding protein [Candidatus Epulonipiscium sp.]
MNYSKEANIKKKKTFQSKNKKIKKRTGLIVFRIFFIALLIAGFAGIGSIMGIVLGFVSTAPEIDEMYVTPEGYASIVYDSQGNELATLYGDEANRIYVELDKIPKHLQQAFIAIEDERFYEHFGIDLKGVARAIVKNIKNHSLSEGASTITQQLIKNNVLSKEKKFERKIQEQYLAIQLEKKMNNKDKILEMYLNTIALGHNTLGVQAASHRYFYKDVSELSLAESAVIAAITQNPSYNSPITFPDNNRKRQKRVLDKMLEQGYITEAEHQAALNEDVYSKIQTVSQKLQAESHNTYFVDEVINQVLSDLQIQKGLNSTQAYNMLFRGGLSIYTTQDSKIQEIVDRAYTNEDLFPPKTMDYELKVMYELSVQHKDKEKGLKHYYREKLLPNEEEINAFVASIKEEIVQPGDKIVGERILKAPQPQSAFVLMDYETGQIKALAGGRGPKEASQTFNRATRALRQPGSAFKPLAVYAPAIDAAGYSPATVVDDIPFSVDIPGQSPYQPKNWYDHQQYNYWGLSSIRLAIEQSMNVVAVKTLMDIGINTGFDYLMNFGFTTIHDHIERNGKSFTDKTPSLALGGLTDGVTVLELTAAYGAIANKGVYTEPILYTKILDHDNNILIENTPKTRRVLKDTTAFLLTDMMKGVITKGTGRLAQFRNVKMPIAGKTGTTNKDIDLTFVGYTPYYVAGIWLGHDTPKSLRYDKSYHNILWRTIMEEVHQDLPIKEFEIPNNIVKVQICADSGKLPVSGLCDADPRGSRIRTEYFVKGTEPTETCDVHEHHTICTASEHLATEYCPEDTKEEKVFIRRPKPISPEILNGSNPPRIRDAQYEVPSEDKENFCDVHGSQIFDPVQDPENPIFPWDFDHPWNSNEQEDSNDKPEKDNQKDNTKKDTNKDDKANKDNGNKNQDTNVENKEDNHMPFDPFAPPQSSTSTQVDQLDAIH